METMTKLDVYAADVADALEAFPALDAYPTGGHNRRGFVAVDAAALYELVLGLVYVQPSGTIGEPPHLFALAGHAEHVYAAKKVADALIALGGHKL